MADKQTRNRFKGELTISAVADEAPVQRGGADLSQFRDILQRSWDKKQANDPTPALGITIPADGAQLAESRFRQAATELGIGVTVTVYDASSDKGRSYGLAQGQARMIVEARQKKASPRRKAQSNGNGTETSAAAPAASAASETPKQRSGGMPPVRAAKVKA